MAALSKWDRKTKHLIRFVLEHGISYEKLDISFSNFHWEIAKFIVDEILEGEILFYVPEYGVWPGPNAYETFHFVRQANGGDASVGDRPAEVLSARSSYARSIVHTAIVSDWDVCLACLDPVCMWYWSHENWLRFITVDREQEQLVRDRFGQPRNEWADPAKGVEHGSSY